MGPLAVEILMLSSLAVADVAVTAVPGAESGRIDPEDHDSGLRVLGRALLFVPRVAVMLLAAPVRTALFAYEYYEIEPRLTKLFFTDDEVVGVYPTISIASDYGINLGARFVHRNLFGAREHLSLRASRGGRYRQRLGAELRTGDRLGERVELTISGEIDRRPKERFYGIGNLDEVPEVRYRQQLSRARAVLDVGVTDTLHVVGAGALADIEYGVSEQGPPITDIYREQALPGWDGIREVYGELELRWDTRRPASPLEPPLVLATGNLVSTFVGRTHRLDDGSDFWRYGIDLQHFVRLGAGPRVVVARLYGEGVTGSLDDVPFSELPQIGGKPLLRGYPLDRFRDRIAVVGSVEYRWDLSYRVAGALFVDVGRVYPSLSDLTIDDMRLGYGIAVEYNTRQNFIGQLSLASSIDGGLFLNLEFDPVFDLLPRVERR